MAKEEKTAAHPNTPVTQAAPAQKVEEEHGIPILYHVRSVMDFGGKVDVEVDWFVKERKHPIVDYSKCILEYDPETTKSAQGAIDELFSEEEAKQLRAFLESECHDLSVSIRRAHLPYPPNCAGLWALGGGAKHHLLDITRSQHYTLPFPVYGHYDERSGKDTLTLASTVSLEHAEAMLGKIERIFSGQGLDFRLVGLKNSEEPGKFVYQIRYCYDSRRTSQGMVIELLQQLIDRLLRESVEYETGSEDIPL